HDCGYLHPSCGVQISAITGAVKAVDPGLAGIGEDRVAFSGYPCGCTEVLMSPLDHEHPVSPERVAAARAGVLPAGEAGRLAGLLGMLADPVRDPVRAVRGRGAVRGRPGAGPGSHRGSGLLRAEDAAAGRDGQLPQGRPGGVLPAVRRLPAPAARALPAPAAHHRLPGGPRCERLTRSVTPWPWPAR